MLVFRMQFFNVLCVFLISQSFGFYNRFSRADFESVCSGERCNDDILSIMLYNSTIRRHMMAILASFDSQRNRLSTNTLFCITGDKFIAQRESKRRGENMKRKKSLFNAEHEC